MGLRGLFEGWHIVILVLVIVVVFGWKRLPDASRSLGRSMRIFKAEVSEMKTDGKPGSAASSDTVRGDIVPPVYDNGTTGTTGTTGTSSTTYGAGTAPTTPTSGSQHQQSA